MIRHLNLLLVTSILLITPAFGTNQPQQEELYQAVQFQDKEAVTKLLAAGVSPEFRENGRPLLGWAAQTGNTEIVAALLKAGANPNTADEGFGHTPLMRAIDMQFVEVVRVLLNGKANPNYETSDGKSCLIMAVESRKPEIVKLLIEAGADTKKVTSDGNSPVLAATQDGMTESLEIIKILGQAKADMNASNAAYTPLIYALEQGNTKLVETLLAAGADANAPTSSGRRPIQVALDKPEVLDLLLKAKANPNVDLGSSDTPLLRAIQEGQVDSVKLLLEAGADPKKADYTGASALEIAERMANTAIVDLLKAKLGNSTATDTTAAIDPGSAKCTIGDAAIKQMEIHGQLQQRVDAGKLSSDIFRTFNEDTKDYGRLLTESPPAACALLERLRTKYGLTNKNS